MTTYINQTLAREHVADLVAQAEAARLRRTLRQARRAQRRNTSADDSVRPARPGPTAAGRRLRWARRLRLVGLR